MSRVYDPSAFDVANIEQAKRIILTPQNTTTEERWAVETPRMADLIGRFLRLDAGTVLLDYGCGIGRMAKELIGRHRCTVIGADISPSMRSLAIGYTQSDNLVVCAPTALPSLGPVAGAAIAVWVLQHCEEPSEDIERIHRALKPGGRLFVANAFARVVPAIERQLFTAVPTLVRKWTSDAADVRALLAHRFAVVEEGRFEDFPGVFPDAYYWAVFEKR